MKCGDLRYAVRMLVRTPGITFAVLLSLGLGIGANVTIFSWVRAVLLEPFPGVREQSRLVMVTARRHGGFATSLSYPDYVDMRVMTMKQWMDWPTISQRLAGTLLSAFGGLAMLLAAVGLYAVMSFAVSQRTREVGIRMALGARPADVWWMVLRYGITLAVIGIAIGLAGALLLMPQMSTLLIGVGPRDVATLAVVSALLSLTAVIASLIPAQRASRVDPIIALRHL
jgi:ABC-type antimicrobial peptide transport system permease subunit